MRIKLYLNTWVHLATEMDKQATPLEQPMQGQHDKCVDVQDTIKYNLINVVHAFYPNQGGH